MELAIKALELQEQNEVLIDTVNMLSPLMMENYELRRENKDMKIITFEEFKDMANKQDRFIFPHNYQEIEDSRLGVIRDRTFWEEVELSSKAREVLLISIINK